MRISHLTFLYTASSGDVLVQNRQIVPADQVGITPDGQRVRAESLRAAIMPNGELIELCVNRESVKDPRLAGHLKTILGEEAYSHFATLNFGWESGPKQFRLTDAEQKAQRDLLLRIRAKNDEGHVPKLGEL